MDKNENVVQKMDKSLFLNHILFDRSEELYLFRIKSGDIKQGNGRYFYKKGKEC